MRTTTFVLAALVALAGCDDTSTPLDGAVDGGGGDRDSGPVTVCERASDCDDGRFCNGAETCAPGDEAADARGCVSPGDPCAEGETCDEDAGECAVDGCDDADGDGHLSYACGGDDCDDDDINRFDNNPEICDDGHDEDCNPETIAGPEGDADSDTFVSSLCMNVRADGSENRGRDCDDQRPSSNPSGTESCNGFDDDCDGMVDEGVLSTFYADTDGDGVGCAPGDGPGCTESVEMGCTAPLGYVLSTGDCDDVQRMINPGAAEVCNGIDDNCDGTTDPGCSCTNGETMACGSDTGVCTMGLQTCRNGTLSVCEGGNMGTVESCNGQDDDCDGSTDEGQLNTYYPDRDGDGYGCLTGDGPGCMGPAALACSQPAGHSAVRGDCRESSPNGPQVNPVATEVCNGYDDNCDGVVDPGCSCVNGATMPCGTDTGVCTMGLQTCRNGMFSVCEGGNMGTVESCNGQDDDCDGSTDEGQLSTYWRDQDMDGFGDPNNTRQACTQPAGYVAPGQADCNDGNPNANPSWRENQFPCDGVDNDCQNGPDDGTGASAPMGAPTWYADPDGDTYGSTAIVQCAQPSGAVSRGGDCDETGSLADRIHPNSNYYSTPHCAGASPCTTAGGFPGCLGNFNICNGSGAPGLSWDYDCSGSETAQPPGCPPFTPCGTYFPSSSQPSSNCGQSVPHSPCCGGASANRPLACR